MAGQGRDVMLGGPGDDTYIVDEQYEIDNRERQRGNRHGTHRWTYYVLPREVEILVSTGSAAFRGVGNDGNNTLIGGAGDDTLDGGLGADWMAGGAGNDLYYVDSLADTVVEAVSGGIDTIINWVSYTLPDNVENLTLIEALLSISGHGNALDNTIRGNDGDNLLRGSTETTR